MIAASVPSPARDRRARRWRYLPQDLSLDGPERLFRGLARRRGEKGRGAHGRDDEIRHGPESGEIGAAQDRRPVVIEPRDGPRRAAAPSTIAGTTTAAS